MSVYDRVCWINTYWQKTKIENERKKNIAMGFVFEKVIGNLKHTGGFNGLWKWRKSTIKCERYRKMSLIYAVKHDLHNSYEWKDPTAYQLLFWLSIDQIERMK